MLSVAQPAGTSYPALHSQLSEPAATWITPPPADTSMLSDQPWMNILPGHPGLLNSILRHLVNSRYSAVSMGNPNWGLRSLDDVHAAAGRSHAVTLEDTRSALAELESHALVEVDHSIKSAPRWRATSAGALSLERTYRRAA
jgi:hypothetical protein